MDTKEQRQRRCNDARLTESGNARSKQLLVVPTESLTNRVWLEWIGTSKARLAFRYEISDLFDLFFVFIGDGARVCGTLKRVQILS